MALPVIISGTQPTGRLHIGNYLGALKNFVELQNSGAYRCYFFIADLHSLTTGFSPREKMEQIRSLAADYGALGLNPRKSVIFLQSAVPAHSEFAWILNTLTPMGELARMTQYKEKSEGQKENVNAGLFTYPTLMAADVLLYDAEFVPVGDDQLQHLELTRTVARKFNALYGQVLIEPKALTTRAPRVMSLGNPEKKMSKSQPHTCLFLDDSPSDIMSKVLRAVTDSDSEIRFDEKRKPAISNLLLIYSSLSGTPIPSLEKQFSASGYGEFKKALARTIDEHFAPYRKKKKALMKNAARNRAILAAGSLKARTQADKKMRAIKKALGIAI